MKWDKTNKGDWTQRTKGWRETGERKQKKKRKMLGDLMEGEVKSIEEKKIRCDLTL